MISNAAGAVRKPAVMGRGPIVGSAFRESDQPRPGKRMIGRFDLLSWWKRNLTYRNNNLHICPTAGITYIVLHKYRGPRDDTYSQWVPRRRQTRSHTCRRGHVLLAFIDSSHMPVDLSASYVTLWGERQRHANAWRPVASVPVKPGWLSMGLSSLASQAWL